MSQPVDLLSGRPHPNYGQFAPFLSLSPDRACHCGHLHQRTHAGNIKMTCVSCPCDRFMQAAA